MTQVSTCERLKDERFSRLLLFTCIHISEATTIMIRNGWAYAQAARGRVPTQPMTTAGLAPIPAYGEAFPPLGPPPTPTSAPAATVSEAVHVVSLCQ